MNGWDVKPSVLILDMLEEYRIVVHGIPFISPMVSPIDNFCDSLIHCEQIYDDS